MPGPLSSTITRKRPSPLVRSPSRAASQARSRTSTVSSGRMPASSHASSELSTASLMVVRSALEGLSKPSRCRFLVKNSEMEISRCFCASCSGGARRLGAFAAGALAGSSSSGTTAGSSAATACGATTTRGAAPAGRGAGAPPPPRPPRGGRAGPDLGGRHEIDPCGRAAFLVRGPLGGELELRRDDDLLPPGRGASLCPLHLRRHPALLEQYRYLRL